MNHIILLGRLTKDTELNASGKVAMNSIAVDRNFKDANGNKVTDFINVKWLGEAKAQFAWKYLSKGMKILIEGSLCVDQYKDQNGNARSSCYVRVDDTEFAESKKQGAPGEASPVTTDENGFAKAQDDEELPFN